MDKEFVAVLIFIAVLVVSMYGYLAVHEKQQTEQIKTCVAAGKNWVHHGDTGDCK